MLDLKNVFTPIEQASGLPNTCYFDATMLQQEQETFFRNNLAAIGFGKDI